MTNMPPAGSFDAVLFDMDGVLIRSWEVWFSVVEEAGRHFRGRPVTREEFAPTFGQGTLADLQHFGLSCSVPELNRFYAEHFGRHLDKVWKNPDAPPLLKQLREEGKRLAVVTNTTAPLAEEILRAAHLWDCFEHVACADQVARPKPWPDLVLHALAALDVSASRACMVGDSRYDRESAGAAGVYFIGLEIDGDARIERLAHLAALTH